MHCNALVYCGLSLNCARAGFAVKARHIFKELIKNVQNVKFDKRKEKSKILAKHTIQGMITSLFKNFRKATFFFQTSDELQNLIVF